MNPPVQQMYPNKKLMIKATFVEAENSVQTASFLQNESEFCG
jgi:hypothetical protein